LTDPDILKSAAAYLLEVARSSDGRRYRKHPKIDALRQYKEDSGSSPQRTQRASDRADFQGTGFDISVPHLVRTVRRFVDEEAPAATSALTVVLFVVVLGMTLWPNKK
jgi:hypothetical protein